jgi:hypothetical protein
MPTYNYSLDSVLAVGNTSTRAIRIPTAALTAYHVGFGGTSESTTIILDMSETSSTTTAGIRSTVEHTGSTGIMRAMQFEARHNGTATAQSPIGGQFTASLAVKNAGTAQVTGLQGIAALQDTVTHASNVTNLQNIMEIVDNGANCTGGIINARALWCKEPPAFSGVATLRRWALLSSGDVQINTNKRLLLGGGDASVGTNYLLGTGSLIETYINSIKVCDFSSTALTFADAYNIAVGSTTGTKIALNSTDKLGFFGATPVVRPAAYTQTYSVASRTVANAAASLPGVTNTLGGWGFSSSAEMTAFVNEIKNLITDDENLRKNINAIIDDKQALGFAG